MRRRGVLQLGAAGLAAMLVQGCSGSKPATGGATAGTSAATSGAGVTASPSPKAVTLGPLPAYSPPTISFSTLKKLFSYDQSAFLSAQLTNELRPAGLKVSDLTIDNSKGDTIPVYVVTPTTPNGLQPGVLFSYDINQTRDDWLPELKALALAGFTAAVCGLDFAPTGDPTHDSQLVIRAVMAQRRALDLLQRRPDDTDRTRLAVVGHGWGGAQAQILAGLESRLSGVVVADCGGRWSQIMAAIQHLDSKTYLNSLTRFDGVRYMSAPNKRKVLLQFGSQAHLVPSAQATELVSKTTGTKQHKTYDTGDDLRTNAAAVADRLAFLKDVLKPA